MAKYFGIIGFSETKEIRPGYWADVIVERKYSGDVIKNVQRWEKGTGANDNLNIRNSISIVSDLYANENFYSIKYVTWRGAKWKVTEIEVQYPRLILTLGGLYNG